MIRHPYFDLLLHDDLELGALLGSPIRERMTLQEWPLSCVQCVVTEDGRKRIYKAQHRPSVESEFYTKARSSLLISAQTVYQSDRYSVMLLEFLEAPTLGEMKMSESAAVEFGKALLGKIAGIEGQLPYHLDLSSEQKWREYIENILKDLHRLVQSGEFQIVRPQMVAALERRAFSEPVLQTFRAGSGYVHHDLAGDNVFVLPDDPRVIDWQFPILAPKALDLAILLESLGFDPFLHVGEGVLWLSQMLRVGWFTECTVHWFPEGRKTYDRQIAEIMMQLSSE
jgi:hypothetical protein